MNDNHIRSPAENHRIGLRVAKGLLHWCGTWPLGWPPPKTFGLKTPVVARLVQLGDGCVVGYFRRGAP